MDKATRAIHLLQCLKGFLERIDMYGYKEKCGHDGCCVADGVHALYIEAMDEAIRCIKSNHGLED